MKKILKIALVYDRVNTPYGGAEKLLLALHEIWPDAVLFTSLYDKNKAKWAKNFKIKTSFLNKFKFLQNKHRLLACLMPLAFENLNLNNFDIVISITSAEAKGVITKPNQLHLCYLLTPPRYLYSHKNFYLKNYKIFKIFLVKKLAQKILNYLTAWDQVAINRPDMIIPISGLVKKRVKKFYNLNTQKIIYPSINLTPNPSPRTGEESYYLLVSRLVSYKKINLAIRACLELNKKLIIIGSGPEYQKLKNLIKNNKNTCPERSRGIKILKNINNFKLKNYYQNAKAILMPGLEDFGIVALEAMSYGKPVIINQNSGAAELIANKKTGILLKKADLSNLKKSILELEQINWDADIIKAIAQKYNLVKFKTEFKQLVAKAWQNYAR